MLGQFHVTKWVEAVAEVAIPAFGVVRVKGATWENPARTVLQIDQCSADNDFPIAINSHTPIAAGGYGWVALEGVVYVLYDNDSTPANGEAWGAQKDSFEIKEGNIGCIILGDVDTEKGIVLVNLNPACGQGGLIGGCLAENHKGRGVVFEIYLGSWSAADHKWNYDTETEVKAIDWRYDVPYPNAGATGLFTPRASDTYGVIMETVALDCDTPGACGS